MRKTILVLAILGCLALVAGPAQADMVAVSINFTNTANALAASDVAGNTAVVGSYANWNNITSGSSVTGLVYSNAVASTVGVSFGGSQWGSGVVIGSAVTAPSGSVDAANTKMMSTGAYTSSYGLQNPTDTLTLSGLNAAFPNGYVIYFYQDAGSPTQSQPGWGSNVATGVLFNGSATGPVAYNSGTAAFNNDWSSNAHQLKMTAAPSNGDLALDTITVSENVNTFVSFTTVSNVITGIQIVGEVSFAPPVAEPAGLGIIGVALLALKKRRS